MYGIGPVCPWLSSQDTVGLQILAWNHIWCKIYSSLKLHTYLVLTIMVFFQWIFVSHQHFSYQVTITEIIPQEVLHCARPGHAVSKLLYKDIHCEAIYISTFIPSLKFLSDPYAKWFFPICPSNIGLSVENKWVNYQIPRPSILATIGTHICECIMYLLRHKGEKGDRLYCGTYNVFHISNLYSEGGLISSW